MDKMISYTTIHRSHTLRKTLNCEGNKWHKVYGGCKNEISNKQELNWVLDVLSISPSKEKKYFTSKLKLVIALSILSKNYVTNKIWPNAQLEIGYTR